MGSVTGVYVGVWQPEFAAVLRHTPLGRSVYAAVAATCSVVVGRLSRLRDSKFGGSMTGMRRPSNFLRGSKVGPGPA